MTMSYASEVDRSKSKDLGIPLHEIANVRIPYELARQVCLQKCYKIRKYLAPLFGPDFVKQCTPDEPEQESVRRRPGRRPRSPVIAPKRSSEEMLDDDSDPTVKDELPSKRPNLTQCASGKINPPVIPADLNMDLYGAKSLDEVCTMLIVARELMRYQLCPLDGRPVNDWPPIGDPRLGGYIQYQGRRYKWNGARGLIERPLTPPVPKTPLPPVRDIVRPKPPSPRQFRFPLTPSPQQSPFAPPAMDWQSPFSSAAGRSLISPPLSLRDSFNGYPRERQSSNGTEECGTPMQEVYSGSLFPTPQPEGRYESRYEEGI
jgi:hypothetical protein